MDIRDYMAGLLSLPPANGTDTTAPFFTSAPETTAVSPSAAAQTPQGSALTGSPTTNGGGSGTSGTIAASPAGPGTVIGGGVVGAPAASASTPSGSAWYVQASQYIAIGLVAVILLALGFYILVSPSPVKEAI